MTWLRCRPAAMAGAISSVFVLSMGPAQATQTFIPTEEFFPGYLVMNVRELDPLLQQVLSAGGPYPDGGYPTLIQADFDGNGITDYAALLRSHPMMDLQNQIFAIVLEFDGGRYELVHSQSFEHVRDDVSLALVDAGTLIRPTQSVDTGKTETQLENPGTMLGYFEKSAVVYYWDETLGGIDEIWISD